jgi:hypothetical protein
MMTTRPNAKAERYTGRVDPDTGPVPVVTRIVAVAIVVAIATEAAVMRPIVVMPPTGSAMHLVDHGAVLDGALHALCSGKPNGSGGLR